VDVKVNTETGKNSNQSKLYSPRNEGQTKFGECLLRAVQDLLSFRLLTKNVKINIYKTIIYLMFCTGVKRLIH
jgi:hypothetical protein